MFRNVSFKNIIDLNLDYISDDDIVRQKEKFGTNNIAETQSRPFVELIKETFSDPMIWLLFCISVIFFFIGQTGEAISLFVAIIPLIFMDAYLHRRTQVSVDSLMGQLSSEAIVLRNGQQKIINSLEIVPGDLVFLSSNIYLPADGIFEDTLDLQIDESALTGEALPIHKKKIILSRDTLYLKENMSISNEYLGFAGTRTLRGSGKLRVLQTGKETLYGEIIQSVASVRHEKTPLQKEITKLVKILSVGSGFMCLILASVRIFQGKGFLDAFLSAATLAVAAIPEEFPVVFTFFLGVGVYRLAKRNALVRRAVSVENIGRVSCICSDKTGTITLGQLKLNQLLPTEGFNELDLIKVSLAASDSFASDPVDQSILEISKIKQVVSPEKLVVFPFTEDRKRESVFVKEDNHNYYCFSKGSPETLLKMSSLSQKEKDFWNENITKFALKGHKVLGCAKREISKDELKLNKEPASGFIFLGLLIFEDPPRKEVKEAIRYCRENAIKVIMITGDHTETARSIAKDVGIGGVDPKVISAEHQPDQFQESWLIENPDFLEGLDVVSRCTPIQKFNIVKSLRINNRVIAVTGDGVNDVPALKAASIGIAMGIRGTKSAKEVASIILTDDNFSTIVHAIQEGKQLYLNLGNSFEYLFLIHIPFVLTAAMVPLLGYPILYLPIHIIWFELIIHPTALFSFQQETIIEKSTSGISKTFLSRKEIYGVLIMGIIVTIVILVSFKRSMVTNDSLNHARSMVIGIMSLWNVGIVYSLTKFKNLASKIISVLTILSTFALIEIPYISEKLHLSSLVIKDWIYVILICLFFFISLKISSRLLKKVSRI